MSLADVLDVCTAMNLLFPATASNQVANPNTASLIKYDTFVDKLKQRCQTHKGSGALKSWLDAMRHQPATSSVPLMTLEEGILEDQDTAKEDQEFWSKPHASPGLAGRIQSLAVGTTPIPFGDVLAATQILNKHSQ